MKLHKLSHLLFFFILLFPASGIIIIGCSSGAIKHYTTINPQDAEAYNNQGNAKSESGDKAGAIADFTQAITINPQLAGAYYNRGNTKDDLGDKAGAIKDYTQAITINPQLAGAYYNRGNTKDDLEDV
jgi:tetratricopeptide (TPR) repeat protein